MNGIRNGRAIKWLPMLAALVCAALFVALGLWQLDRAAQKEAILQNYAARGKAAPVALPLDMGSLVENAEDWRYRHVQVAGQFDAAHQFLLDNQVNRGRAGYQVLTPLRLADRRYGVLIDRGWIPLGSSRARLPDVTVTKEQVALRGTIYVPYGRRFSLGDMSAEQNAWPRRVQFLDFDRMAKSLDYPLAPLTVRLDASAPHGYLREWQTVPFGPERHLGYAVQWFALAATVIVILFVLTIKSLRKR